MRKTVAILAMILPLLLSCVKEDVLCVDVQRKEYTVAIIAPLTESDEYTSRLERIADWFTEEFREGQKGLTTVVTLKYEWIDETPLTDSQLKQLGRDLSMREDVAAVIGPFYSHNLDIVASKMYKAGKPMIAPMATSDEIQRKYSVTETGMVKKPFLWCISPSDVAQTGLILSSIVAQSYNPVNPEYCPKICLVSPDDTYGQTFQEWIPFQAVSMGLDMKSNIVYSESGNATIENCLEQAFQENSEFIICAAGTAADALRFAKKNRELCKATPGQPHPSIYYTDATFNAAFLADAQSVESARGTAMYAAPSSGFVYAYEVRYGELPTPDECMLYDALLLTGMACNVALHTGQDKLNDVIGSMMYSNPETYSSWNRAGMAHYLSGIDPECLYALEGVTGVLVFDYEAHTSRYEGYYAEWTIVDGKFRILGCVTSNRDESMAKWRMVSNDRRIDQQFRDSISIEYGPMLSRWALLVCTSTDWSNYRHAADVIGVYHRLKDIGYTDDHIVLVFADNYSGDVRNLYPGEIRRYPYEENSIDDVRIDYSPLNLRTQDISDILLGHKSASLPVVLETDTTSNIFIYWTGHGDKGSFVYPNGRFTSEQLRNTLMQMSLEKRFRQILICAEPCHSGSVLQSLEGIRGVLGIASSYAEESSFADVFDYDMDVWMNDRFTSNLLYYTSGFEVFGSSYYELYNNLWNATLGSHVQIFNADNFGNMYIEFYSDFLK